MTDTYQGACFCGAIEIEISSSPMEMGYCHCTSCRAYSGAPVSAFMLWKADQVRVTKGSELLGRFNKTGMSDRQFCQSCGGHIMTHHPDLGLTDVRPPVIRGMDFEPSVHLNYSETVLPIRDALPKLKDFPAAAGGSGETVSE